MDPEFRIYKRIDAVDLEVEIEKGCTKARYHFMSEKEGGNIRRFLVMITILTVTTMIEIHSKNLMLKTRLQTTPT